MIRKRPLNELHAVSRHSFRALLERGAAWGERKDRMSGIGMHEVNPFATLKRNFEQTPYEV